VYVDLTTNSPAVVRQVARRFEAKGVAMVDAPVSGGMEGARTRDLLIMVGGDPATFERVRPLLDTIATRVLHTGEIGCGTIAKLMHNCASFTLDLVMAECWTTGVKAGVAPEAIVEAFRSAALGQMMSLKVRLPATYLRGDFTPRFALRLARKDLGLALDLARTCDVPMRLGALCEQEMADAMARGWGDQDSSIFLTLQEERAGATVRVRGSTG
jgi:3-hydroxyisobutyrate dehydrogenase